jgi:hypothetical protein
MSEGALGRIHMSEGHDMSNGSTPARPLSDAEVKQLQSLQAVFDPAAAFKRIDDFAKWIFGSIAVVGTLGAGFSNSAFSNLGPCGKVLFAIAILLIGLSLYFVTRTLEPRWVHANTSSRESMLAAVDSNLRARKAPLLTAATLFATSIVFAAFAPLSSLLCSASKSPAEPRVQLGFEIKSDGKTTGQLSASGMKPFTPIELTFVTQTLSALPLAPVAHKYADEHGQATLAADLPDVTKFNHNLNLLARWGDSADSTELSHQQSISVLSAVPNGTQLPASK